MSNVYYVYKHIDPRTQEVVYIGKGRGGRAWDVTRSRAEYKEHQEWMTSLMEKGHTPDEWVVIVTKGLSEKEALLEESNTRHAQGVCRFNRQSGQRNYQAKMTDAQALEAYDLVKNKKWQHKDVAAKFGVSRSAISMLVTGKQWRAVTAGVRIEDQ